MSTDDPGSTFLRVERPAPDSGAPVRARTRSGLLVPRLVHLGPGNARVVLVATRALLLGGDEVEITVEVGSGVHLDLCEVAATVAYDGRGSGARWRTRIRVEEGGSLTWLGEPLVVSDGADVVRSTRVDVAEGARLQWRETLALGRAGERGGRLSSRTDVRVGGRPVLVEDLDVDGAQPDPLVMGEARVLDQMVFVGVPAYQGPGCLRLALVDGSVGVRWLGAATHLSPLHASGSGAGNDGAVVAAAEST